MRNDENDHTITAIWTSLPEPITEFADLRSQFKAECDHIRNMPYNNAFAYVSQRGDVDPDFAQEMAIPMLTTELEKACNALAFDEHFDGLLSALSQVGYHNPKLSDDVANAFAQILCHDNLEPAMQKKLEGLINEQVANLYIRENDITFIRDPNMLQVEIA